MDRKWRSSLVVLTTLAISFGSLSAAGRGPDKASSPSTVYVSKILEGMVAVIDVNTDKLITFLRTGTNPAEIAVVEARDRAYVADLTDGTVTVIDTTDHSIVTTIDMGHPVAAADADQTLQRVYVLDFSNGTLFQCRA